MNIWEFLCSFWAENVHKEILMYRCEHIEIARQDKASLGLQKTKDGSRLGLAFGDDALYGAHDAGVAGAAAEVAAQVFLDFGF